MFSYLRQTCSEIIMSAEIRDSPLALTVARIMLKIPAPAYAFELRHTQQHPAQGREVAALKNDMERIGIILARHPSQETIRSGVKNPIVCQHILNDARIPAWRLVFQKRKRGTYTILHFSSKLNPSLSFPPSC